MTTTARKPNARQHTFVTHILAGESEVSAYKLAGYKGEPHTLYGSASRLLATATVQASLAIRRDEKAKTEGIDLQTIVSALQDNADAAKAAGQHSAVNQAWALIGKSLGLIIERSEVKTFSISGDITTAIEGMSTDELRALVAGSVRQALPSGGKDD